jgi:hypothetical protein
MEVNKKYMKLDYYLKKIEKENENKKNVGIKKSKTKRIKRNSYENASELLNEKKKDFDKIKKSKNKKISFEEENLNSFIKNNKNVDLKKDKIMKSENNDEKDYNKNLIYEKEKTIIGENNSNVVVVELKNNLEKLRNEFSEK